jgi:hypothetical protein
MWITAFAISNRTNRKVKFSVTIRHYTLLPLVVKRICENLNPWLYPSWWRLIFFPSVKFTSFYFFSFWIIGWFELKRPVNVLTCNLLVFVSSVLSPIIVNWSTQGAHQT